MKERGWILMLIAVLAAAANAAAGGHSSASAAAAGPTVVGMYTLPRMSLAPFADPPLSEEILKRATLNGLQFTDLPSIGSGLARVGPNEFVGITDRGPNGKNGEEEGKGRRTFPLPMFCPSIVRLALSNSQIRVTACLLLRDSRGKPLTGLSNTDGEERLFESPDAAQPLPFDPNGVDPEGIRILPDGNFLVSEEYSPSILVVGTRGNVLVRYTPVSKPLTHASYPVKAILPDVYARRRANRGFENLALSADGRFAYVILQSPMGDVGEARYAESRMLRALKLDVSQPLEASVLGEYLVPASPAQSYAGGPKQQKISWSDADCIAPDRLLVIERAKGETRLLLVDLSRATNILRRDDEPELGFEDATRDVAALGVETAQVRELYSLRGVGALQGEKLEGLSVLGRNEIALANDNDFGLGDNATGRPSRIWILRLPEPLPLPPSP
jgi:hypothetical protein